MKGRSKGRVLERRPFEKSRLKLKRRSCDVLTYRILEENERLNGSCLTEMRFTNSWIYEYKNILRGICVPEAEYIPKCSYSRLDVKR